MEGGRFSGLRFLSVHSLGDNTVLLNSSSTEAQLPLGRCTGEGETAGMKISSSNSQTTVLCQNRPVQERSSAPSFSILGSWLPVDNVVQRELSWTARLSSVCPPVDLQFKPHL